MDGLAMKELVDNQIGDRTHGQQPFGNQFGRRRRGTQQGRRLAGTGAAIFAPFMDQAPDRTFPFDFRGIFRPVGLVGCSAVRTLARVLRQKMEDFARGQVLIETSTMAGRSLPLSAGAFPRLIRGGRRSWLWRWPAVRRRRGRGAGGGLLFGRRRLGTRGSGGRRAGALFGFCAKEHPLEFTNQRLLFVDDLVQLGVLSPQGGNSFFEVSRLRLQRG